jgi:hypothetical protein
MLKNSDSVFIIFYLFTHLFNKISCQPTVSTCASPSHYTTAATGIVITRKDQNLGNEKFFTITDYQIPDLTVAGSIQFTVIPIDILDAGIFFGVCVYDPVACGAFYTDIIDVVKFSGIGITYFGEDCYHIDMYINGAYWTTPKHCLSTYELKNMKFIFKVDSAFTGGNNLADMTINFDNYDYFVRSNLFINSINAVPGFKVLNACTYMFGIGSTIEIKP